MISIIVPVYNVEEVLPICLGSLTSQTYRDLEIICVNDGSKDNSLEILKGFAARDSRIKLIDRENRGPSLTRNEALDIVHGEWTMFVDSDDWLEPETCEKALQAAQEKQADVVLWAYVREFRMTSAPKLYLEKETVWDENVAELRRRMVGPIGSELKRPDTMDAICTIWGKLYRTELIQQAQPIRFVDTKEIGSCEDVLFNISYMGRCQKAVYLPRCWYHYRKVDSSFTSANNPTLPAKWHRLYEELRKILQQENLGSDYQTALDDRISLGIIGLGLNEVFANSSLSSKRKAIKKLLERDEYRAAIKHFDLSQLPLHWRMFFACAKHGSAMGVLFFLLIIRKIINR